MNSGRDYSGVRVLVVDDYLLTRDMVRAILRGIGFTHVVTAENGEIALRALEQHAFHLVICDWNMPTMSGIELLRAVRAMPRYKTLPFLMLTAEAYRENVLEATKAGVTDYVAKPFTAEVLGSKIEEMLNRTKQ